MQKSAQDMSSFVWERKNLCMCVYKSTEYYLWKNIWEVGKS